MSLLNTVYTHKSESLNVIILELYLALQRSQHFPREIDSRKNLEF